MKTTSKRTRKKSPVADRSAPPEWLRHWQRDRRPVVLKINDTLTYQIEDDPSIERLAYLVDRLRTVAAIREGLEDVDHGRSVSFEDFQNQARHRTA